MRKQDIIVIGCRGFIGSALYRYVRSRYKGRVRGVSSDDIDLRQPSSVTKLGRLFHRRAQVVVVAGVTPEGGDTLRTFDENVKIVSHLAQALIAHPVRRCLYLSTVSVYGRQPKEGLITERMPICPDSLYRITKHVGEVLLSQATRFAQTQCLILRLPRVYGQGDRRSSYGPSAFVRMVLQGRSIRLFGDGKEYRAFLYVEDLARIVGALLRCDAEGVINVAPPKSFRFVDVVTAVEKAMHKSASIIHVPRSGVKYDERYQIKRLQSFLPRFQFTSLEEGVRALVASKDL